MWYVVRRARYELNKVCLPPPKEPFAKPNLLRHSKSSAINGFHFSSYNLEQYDDSHCELDELKEKPETKLGHKRAKSASAVLIDVENI